MRTRDSGHLGARPSLSKLLFRLIDCAETVNYPVIEKPECSSNVDALWHFCSCSIIHRAFSHPIILQSMVNVSKLGKREARGTMLLVGELQVLARCNALTLPCPEILVYMGNTPKNQVVLRLLKLSYDSFHI